MPAKTEISRMQQNCATVIQIVEKKYQSEKRFGIAQKGKASSMGIKTTKYAMLLLYEYPLKKSAMTNGLPM